MPIETIMAGGWLKVRCSGHGDDAPWFVLTSDEGVSGVLIERRSESLSYVSYVRNGERRKRMVVHVSKSISIGPEIRAERRRP